MNLTKLRNALSLFDRFRPLKRPQFPVNTKLVARQECARAQTVANGINVDRDDDPLKALHGDELAVKRLTKAYAEAKKTIRHAADQRRTGDAAETE